MDIVIFFFSTKMWFLVWERANYLLQEDSNSPITQSKECRRNWFSIAHIFLAMVSMQFLYICTSVFVLHHDLCLHICDSRFSKRKLDESVFLGNRLQVSYAPQFESLHETKEKLEARRKEVLARLNRKYLITKLAINLSNEKSSTFIL